VLIAAVLIAAMVGLYVSEKKREQATWIVVEDQEFNDAEDADRHWRSMIMSWKRWPALEVVEEPALTVDDERAKVKDGSLLYGDKEMLVNVVSRLAYSGDLRVEWTGRSLKTAENMNVFLGENRSSGYTLHIGSWGDPSFCALTRGTHDIMLQQVHLQDPIVAGKSRDFRIEREGMRLRFWIDESLIFDYIDIEGEGIVEPAHFGFDAWSGHWNVLPQPASSWRWYSSSGGSRSIGWPCRRMTATRVTLSWSASLSSGMWSLPANLRSIR
jgi:hypothetical protein